jgi:hypothetical protein
MNLYQFSITALATTVALFIVGQESNQNAYADEKRGGEISDLQNSYSTILEESEQFITSQELANNLPTTATFDKKNDNFIFDLTADDEELLYSLYSPQSKDFVISQSQVSEIENVKDTKKDTKEKTFTGEKLENFCRSYPLNSQCIEFNRLSALQTSLKVNKRITANKTLNLSNLRPVKKGLTTSGWAITPEASTLGLGGSVTALLSPNLNARVALNTISVGVDLNRTDIDYNANLNLFNVSTMLDYHPFKESGFRLTGGIVFNNNNISGTARAGENQLIRINGNTYNSAVLGKLDADVTFSNPVAPYIGIGWGNAVKPGNRVGFSVNLGLVFPGPANIDLTANTSITNPLALQRINRDVEAEERRLKDTLSDFNVYPVLSVGVSYQF